MLTRWTLLTLILGALAGYALTGTSAEAQGESLPFAIGDTVTLWFGKDAAPPSLGSGVRCVVDGIRGAYVRCKRSSRVGGGSGDDNEHWVTMKYVIHVTKHVN